MLKLIKAIIKSIKLEDVEFISAIVFILSCILIIFGKMLNINTILIVGIILWIPSTICTLGLAFRDMMIIIKEETKEMMERIKNNLD